MRKVKSENSPEMVRCQGLQLPDLAPLAGKLAELEKLTASYRRSAAPPDDLVEEFHALKREQAEILTKQGESLLAVPVGAEVLSDTESAERATAIANRLTVIEAAFAALPKHRFALGEQVSKSRQELLTAAEQILAPTERAACDAAVEAFRQLQGAVAIIRACRLESSLPIRVPDDVRFVVPELREITPRLRAEVVEVVGQLSKIRLPLESAMRALERSY